MSGSNHNASGLLAAVLTVLGAASVLGQRTAAPLSPVTDVPATNTVTTNLVVTADKMTHDRRTGWVEALGNVRIERGSEALEADYVRVNTLTEDATAIGNVRFYQGGAVWTGRRLDYNFRERRGAGGSVTCDASPFRLLESREGKVEGGTYYLKEAVVTTCTNDPPHRCHYRASVDDLKVLPGEHMKARRMTLRFGRVPVFYMPYWYRNLREDVGFRFYPGYSSDMGAFILTSARYRLSPAFRGVTHVDPRSERGVGLGQDLKWRAPDGRWSGKVMTYFIDDREPVDEDAPENAEEIDNERYRVRLMHRQAFTDRDYALAQAHYLSDINIRRDFFEDEYRDSRQPENYFVYTHRRQSLTAGAAFRGRINDFYNQVNRLPEGFLNVNQQQVGESQLYYESASAATFLEKVWKAADTNREDYSAFRVDTDHMVSCPQKYFGFLSVVPRAGYRGTYYSVTRDTETTLEIASETVEVGPGTNRLQVTTNELVHVFDGSAAFRSRVELGVGASFKAFRTWGAPEGADAYRHIVEPYANYTLVPEPTVDADDLYKFDKVDELDDVHEIRFGMRNKIQRKINDQPFDLVDLDTYTVGRLDREGDEEFIETLYFDAELASPNWLVLQIDGRYDIQESEMTVLNTRLAARQARAYEVGLEHRYRLDDSSLLTGDVTVCPGRPWELNIYSRYEAEDARFEEHAGYIQRNLDCMSIRTGFVVEPGYTRSDGTEEEDDWRVIVSLWLTAFPDFDLGRHRH